MSFFKFPLTYNFCLQPFFPPHQHVIIEETTLFVLSSFPGLDLAAASLRSMQLEIVPLSSLIHKLVIISRLDQILVWFFETQDYFVGVVSFHHEVHDTCLGIGAVTDEC